MKTYFKSSEIEHIWAHQSAPYGRTPSAVSFQGRVLRSYATDMGYIMEPGRTVILNRGHYSVTTSSHQSAAAFAVNHFPNVFHVEGMEGMGDGEELRRFTPKSLRDHYVKSAKEIEAETPSRYARIRERQFHSATEQYGEARRVCVVFGLAHKSLDTLIAKRNTDIQPLVAARIEQHKRAEAKKLRDATTKAIADAERFVSSPEQRRKDVIVEQSEKLLSLLPEELRARFLRSIEEHNAGLLARWYAGEPIGMPHDAAGRLRASGDDMETSKGARVPLVDAKRTFRFCMAVRAKGWHRNGEQHAIGHYSLDAVNAEGVIAGCHRVKWEEIERFGASQGWKA